MNEQYLASRKLKERIVVTGKLVLETPAHFGAGDSDSPVDMPLLRDALDQTALLPGATLAGALRGLLILQSGNNEDLAKRLFGSVDHDTSRESWLIVNDAHGGPPQLELRDGVALDPKTRTAEDKKKFDFELLAAGSEFDLSFELLVPLADGDELVHAFAACLEGLTSGQISLGKRKRRGFGRCKVAKWTLTRYDMTSPAGLFRWLDRDASGAKSDPSAAQLLLGEALPKAALPWCELEADFDLDGSLLIRSGAGEAGSPDAVHLHSIRNGKPAPILSGTSLAGALRARALCIANTLDKNGYALADDLFGIRSYGDNPHPEHLTASRVWVDEAEIIHPLERVQSRLKIDRFTGGAYPGALFSEQPVFGAGAGVHIRLRLFEPKEEEVGLLLLLLKDLWLGDLTLGGESSVGRGRLKGKSAVLRFKGKEWTLTQAGDAALAFGGDGEPSKLQEYVTAFTGVKHG